MTKQGAVSKLKQRIKENEDVLQVAIKDKDNYYCSHLRAMIGAQTEALSIIDKVTKA